MFTSEMFVAAVNANLMTMYILFSLMNYFVCKKSIKRFKLLFCKFAAVWKFTAYIYADMNDDN